MRSTLTASSAMALISISSVSMIFGSRIELLEKITPAPSPYRERRGSRGPLGPPARVAGRNARLRDVHPAGIPPRPHSLAAHLEDHGFRGYQEHRGGAADAGQHPAHQGLLGDDDPADRPDRA